MKEYYPGIEIVGSVVNPPHEATRLVKDGDVFRVGGQSTAIAYLSSLQLSVEF